MLHNDALPMDSQTVLDPRALIFRNRLRKNLRRLIPWARQNGLDAYRLYDSDIPEVRLIVERYCDRLAVWEYTRRADLDPEEDRKAIHDHFLDDVEAILAKECS